MAGALYGLDEEILELYYAKMLQFDELSTFVKAYKLFKQKPIKTKLIIPYQDQSKKHENDEELQA